MPVDYYPNKSIEELEKILCTLQSQQEKGAIVETTVAGVRTVRTFGRGGRGDPFANRRETEILRVLYSLFLRAQGSDEAQNYKNPYADRIRRTRARYTYS